MSAAEHPWYVVTRAVSLACAIGVVLRGFDPDKNVGNTIAVAVLALTFAMLHLAARPDARDGGTT